MPSKSKSYGNASRPNQDQLAHRTTLTTIPSVIGGIWSTIGSFVSILSILFILSALHSNDRASPVSAQPIDGCSCRSF